MITSKTQRCVQNKQYIANILERFQEKQKQFFSTYYVF